MSGIAGIVNLDYSPIDRVLLDRLTNALVFRGPDAQKTWFRGPVGFGHTLLCTSKESENESQPLTLDGNSWIVADARVDGRADLIAKIESHGQECTPETPDVELILRAYQIWDENCVNHLIGDFVFAIWNARTRRLFCARDQFGIKPFFYAQIQDSLIFSNTLDCLRHHHGVSERLNDLAIADFLLFDRNQDLNTSAFADIRRLPPAHTLHCEQGKISTRRYWLLPEAKPLQFQRPQECLEQFQHIFDTAVSDRLRSDSAGILLSGGLDSPIVAASASRVLRRRNSNFDFRGFTMVHDSLIPHEERYYAGLVAEALSIPVEFLPADNSRLFDNYEDPNYRKPEPAHFPMGFRNFDPYEHISSFSRTALTGFGGDPALASLLSAHFRRLYTKHRFGQTAKDAFGYLTAEGRLSRLYVRKRLQRWFRKNHTPEFVGWLDPGFVKRLNLRERWGNICSETESNNSARPEAHSHVAARYWTLNFESFDPGILGARVESCHPFFDLRVLNFLLALPALPWCSDKELFRQAGKGVLPDAVRLRKKSPLPQDPIVALLQKPEAAWVDSFEPGSELRDFIQIERIPRVYRCQDSGQAWSGLKPLSLNLWLQRRNNYRSHIRETAPQSHHTLAVAW